MASTYSTNLAIELIATGEQAGTWGTTTDTNLGTLIEQAISGYVTQAITDGSGANTTLSMTNGASCVARNMSIEMTGALTFDTCNLIIPANKKLYNIYNNTTGSHPVTVKVSGQTGVLVPNGKRVLLTCNGTDAVESLSAVVGNFTFGGTLGVTGATTLSSTLGVTGKITATTAGIDIPVSALGTAYSSSYTPSVSNTTNVASSTPHTTGFIRVGNYVQVSGGIAIDPTTTGETSFEITLPVASNIGATSDVGGSFVEDTNFAAGYISGVSANDTAFFRYSAIGLAAQNLAFTFGYRII